jgi:RimJ/RimL family protein N-acetyltransferase
MEDRFDIMQWRNEQMFHLRQHKILTPEDQDYYFKTVVANLFDQTHPAQILFSYLDGDTCIGYGGLVHIDWINRNAEISFIMNTELENQFFEFHWSNYLTLLEQVAFNELELHKIFTYAFDLRPHLYPVFEKMYFNKEAVLKEHVCFNNKFIDVVIHSKLIHNKSFQYEI